MQDTEVLEEEAGPFAEVKLRGKTLQIRPLDLGLVPKFTRLVRALLPSFARASVDLEEGKDDAVAGAILDLLADHGDELIDAMALAARCPRADIEAAQLDEAFNIVRAVIKVNRSFFADRLTPLLAEFRVGDGGSTSTGPTSPPSS